MTLPDLRFPYRELNLPPSPVNTIYVAGIVQNLSDEAFLLVQLLLKDAQGRFDPYTQRVSVDKNDSGVEHSNVAIRLALRYVDSTATTTICHTVMYQPTLDLAHWPNVVLRHLNRPDNPAWERLMFQAQRQQI